MPFYPIWTIAGCQKQCRSCYRTSDNISRTCHNLSALWLIGGSKITEACWVPMAQETSDLESEALLDVTDRDMSVKSGEKAMRKGKWRLWGRGNPEQTYNSVLVWFVNKMLSGAWWLHCAGSIYLNGRWLDMLACVPFLTWNLATECSVW